MFGAHQMQAITFTEKPLKFNIIFHEGHAIVNTSQNPNVVPGAILQSIGGVDVSMGKLPDHEVLNTLRASVCPFTISFMVPPTEPSMQPSPQPQYVAPAPAPAPLPMSPTSQSYPVTFYEKPLGFNVKQLATGCYVNKSKNANVLEGSRVLEVNGVDVRGLENTQLRSTLRAAALPISILFAVPDSGMSMASPMVGQPGLQAIEDEHLMPNIKAMLRATIAQILLKNDAEA